MFYQIKHALKSRKNHSIKYRRLKFMTIMAILFWLFIVFSLPTKNLIMLPIHLGVTYLGFIVGQLHIRNKVRYKDKYFEFQGSDSYLIIVATVIITYFILPFVFRVYWVKNFRDVLEVFICGFIIGRYYYCRSLVKSI